LSDPTYLILAYICRVKGTRFFECPRLQGGMVRPDKVKVGDYPERDPFEEDEI
jgi:tubulin-folding cofactor B